MNYSSNSISIPHSLPLYQSLDGGLNHYNFPVCPYKMVKVIKNSIPPWTNVPSKDQVKANIESGLLLCNFEPYQEMNYKMYQRNFFVEPQADVPPFQRVQQVDNESNWIRPRWSKDELNCNNQKKRCEEMLKKK
jgi:hypothetical protein